MGTSPPGCPDISGRPWCFGIVDDREQKAGTSCLIGDVLKWMEELRRHCRPCVPWGGRKYEGCADRGKPKIVSGANLLQALSISNMSIWPVKVSAVSTSSSMPFTTTL